MNFENDIPAFAMLPAKSPDEQIIIPPADTIKNESVKVIRMVEPEKISFVIEEDVLVPDTHPDMNDILMISGKAILDDCEVEIIKGKKADACGIIDLQVLYLPEKDEEDGIPLNIKSGIRFRQMVCDEKSLSGVMWISAAVMSIESSIINERKYRVKIEVDVHIKRFESWEKEYFKEIQSEEMEYLKKAVAVCDVSVRVKDILEISEEVILPEEICPVKILNQDIKVMENYRQVTSEKIVLNGFLLVNILYSGHIKDEENQSSIRQLQEKIEFTQFIALQNHGQWKDSRMMYDTTGLKVSITDDNGRNCMLIEGSLITRAALIKEVQKEFVVDAYHRKKDFVCDYEENEITLYEGNVSSETTVRDIANMEGIESPAESVIYITGDVREVCCKKDGTKTAAEGRVAAKLLYRCKEGKYNVCRKDIPFRCVLSSGAYIESQITDVTVSIKDMWAEIINGRQMEINAAVNIQGAVVRKEQYYTVKKPAFRECESKETTGSVIIYIAREGDTMWSISKKFKTGKLSICKHNNVENNEIEAGKKLLIMR